MRALLGVLLLVGCGDPREAFVGTYKGTSTFTYTDGSNNSSSSNVTFSITAPEKSDRLQFSSKCAFTAVPTDDDSIRIDPISCPPQRLSTLGGAMATYTSNFKTGSGELVNKTLTLAQTGTQIGTDYSDGTADQQYPFRLDVVVTRQ